MSKSLRSVVVGAVSAGALAVIFAFSTGCRIFWRIL